MMPASVAKPIAIIWIHNGAARSSIIRSIAMPYANRAGGRAYAEASAHRIVVDVVRSAMKRSSRKLAKADTSPSAAAAIQPDPNEWDCTATPMPSAKGVA